MSKIINWSIVEKFIEERKPKEVSVGLLQDWYWTAASVYENGEWKDRDRAYASSDWATPGFEAVMDNGDTIRNEAGREMTEEDHAERRRRTQENHDAIKAMADSLPK